MTRKEVAKELKEDLRKLIGKRVIDVRLDTFDHLSFNSFLVAPFEWAHLDLVFDDGTVLELYFLGRRWTYRISKEGEE